VVERALRRHPPRRAADDDAELGLPVHLGRRRRDLDGGAVAHHGVGELGEEDRLGRHRLAGLLRVVAVVEADADDLARPWHGGHPRHLAVRRPFPLDHRRAGEERHQVLAHRDDDVTLETAEAADVRHELHRTPAPL
jgi:hypothetical protein